MGSLCEKENLYSLFFETLIPHHLTTGSEDLSPRIQEFLHPSFPFAEPGGREMQQAVASPPEINARTVPNFFPWNFEFQVWS